MQETSKWSNLRPYNTFQLLRHTFENVAIRLSYRDTFMFKSFACVLVSVRKAIKRLDKTKPMLSLT